MGAGRRWALETLGTYGPRIREQIAQMVKDEHVSSLDAQDASGHRSRSVYGEFWRGILEKFELFGDLPGATLVRPGGAPYRIPVVNGVGLYPWRYAKNRETELVSTPFGTSDARMALADLRPPAVQGAFDFALPDAGLTEEEQDLLATFQSVTADPVVTSSRLLLVAISSSVNGLFSVQWGEVALAPTGYVEWIGFHESLMSMQSSQPVSTAPTRTFTSGELPSKFPETQVEKEDAPSDG